MFLWVWLNCGGGGEYVGVELTPQTSNRSVFGKVMNFQNMVCTVSHFFVLRRFQQLWPINLLSPQTCHPRTRNKSGYDQGLWKPHWVPLIRPAGWNPYETESGFPDPK